MKLTYLLPALLLMGCAHDPTIADTDIGPLPDKPAPSSTGSVRTPEQLKAYPVGRYEDPNDPGLMHEGHTVYRAESSPEWNTAPNAPTYLPLGPTVAVADPAQQHTALTAELEQRLKREDQLLQTTYEQNKRLAQEIKVMAEQIPHLRLSLPDAQAPQKPSVSASQPKPPADSPSQPSPVKPATQKSWLSWLWPFN